MAGGLARQLSFCSSNTSGIDTNAPPRQKPSWCTDEPFMENLRDAQARLWRSIEGAQAGKESIQMARKGKIDTYFIQKYTLKCGRTPSIIALGCSQLRIWRVCRRTELNRMQFNCGRTGFWDYLTLKQIEHANCETI